MQAYTARKKVTIRATCHSSPLRAPRNAPIPRTSRRTKSSQYMPLLHLTSQGTLSGCSSHGARRLLSSQRDADDFLVVTGEDAAVRVSGMSPALLAQDGRAADLFILLGHQACQDQFAPRVEDQRPLAGPHQAHLRVVTARCDMLTAPL